MSWIDNDLDNKSMVLDFYTKYDITTNFNCIAVGSLFPPLEVKHRNRQYRFMQRLYNGDYSKNKKLNAVIDGQHRNINYNTLSLNYFELMVNKMYGLLFGNDITIKTGKHDRDIEINKLVERTGWINSIAEAVKLCEIYGDSCIRTYKHGASPLSPLHAFKVVNSSNIKEVIGFVLYELLYDIDNNGNYNANHIRLLVTFDDLEYEIIHKYNGNEYGGTIGDSVRYKYRDRWVPRSGRYYKTDTINAVQWLSINTTKNNNVYGSSPLMTIKDIVFALENRISTDNWVVDAHGKPILVVGMSSIDNNNMTGEQELKLLNGKYLIDKGQDTKDPHYITWDGKLDASRLIREDLMSSFYELSEMGRTFLSGEYSGNISEETLNNTIKSAIDRANRDLSEMWYSIRNSLYVLCTLNDIDIDISDINIDFNVGRVDDDSTIANICEKLNTNRILSKQTLLGRYFGYSAEQAEEELNLINKEGM